MDVALLVVITAENDLLIYSLERAPPRSDPLWTRRTVLACNVSSTRVVLYWLHSLPSRDARDFWKSPILQMIDPLHAEEYVEIKNHLS